MSAVEIDMSAGAAEAVGAFGFEGERLSIGEQGLGARFNFLTQSFISGASGTVSGFWAVPTEQAQANAFCAAIGQALQFKCVAIDRKDVAHRCIDTSRARLIAEVFGFRRQIALGAGRKTQAET